jgi:hypothetical protein
MVAQMRGSLWCSARRPGDRTASPRRRWREGAGAPPARWVRLCTGWTGPNFVAAQRCGLRQFSPPPADAALAEELVVHRVHEKVRASCARTAQSCSTRLTLL